MTFGEVEFHDSGFVESGGIPLCWHAL